MKLFKKLKFNVSTTDEYVVRLPRMSYTEIVGADESYNPPEYCHRKYKYEFSTTLYFNSTPENFNQSVKKAREVVINELYGDILSELYTLDYLVYNGDTEEASKLIQGMVDGIKSLQL